MSNGNPKSHSGVWTRLLRLIRREKSRVEPDDPRARSWARRVESYADLPKVYAPFVDSLPRRQREPFPYSVLTPTFRGSYGRSEKEHLLCIVDDEVHMLQFVDNRLHADCFSTAEICFLERGSILLHAWLTMAAQDGTGLRSTSIRYSSVTDYLMAPFLECLRAAPTAGSAADLAAERSRFVYLTETHFKFMSYGQGSIRPGACVRRILLQPEVRREYLGLLGFSISRLVWPAHLTILTDSELILIRDDDSQRWTRGSPHGAIWTYIPRRKIVDASVTSGDDGRQALSIALPGGTCIRSIFDSAQRPQLELLLSELRS